MTRAKEHAELLAALGTAAAGVWTIWNSEAREVRWITVGLLLLVFVGYFLPRAIQRHRRQQLEAYSVTGELQDPGYFRLRPYEDSDRDRFTRADGRHEEILAWLQKVEPPLLYLTGISGAGKSSLLQAFVLPRLAEAEPPVRALTVRSFQDPAGELVKALLKPGVVWERPPAEDTEPRRLLERAVRYLGADRLLVVLDQFEELLILQEDGSEIRKRQEALLQSLVAEPIPGLQVLLVVRSDFMQELQRLPLPHPGQEDNWREVGPFTLPHARAFLEGSGRTIGPALVQDALAEAQEIEEAPGLIRPITLNLLGMVLGSVDGRLPKSLEPRALLRSHLKSTLNRKETRDAAAPVLRSMITEAGTKRPRSVAELQETSGLDAPEIRGCLLHLGNAGLVRPLRRDQEIWEMSHDFLARLLSSLLARQRRPLWQAAVPWLGPVMLGLWVITLLGVHPMIKDVQENRLRAALAAYGVFVSTDLTEARFEPYGPATSRPLYILKNMPALRALSLSTSLTIDMKALTQLTQLRTLDLRDALVYNDHVKALAQLAQLQKLNLAGTSVENLTPLAQLTQLTYLDLENTPIDNDDLEVLAQLTQLQELYLSGTGADDLTPLAQLTQLRYLDLANTPTANDDLEVLAQLTQLQTLDLSGTSVDDLTPLAQLTQLEILVLIGTPAEDLAPVRHVTHIVGKP